MEIPLLSCMTTQDSVIMHTDSERVYAVLIKPSHGMIVAFSDGLLYKIQGDRELFALKKTAIANKIPRENVLFLDCEHNCMAEMTDLIRYGLVSKVSFSAIRSNALWPKLMNKNGLAITDRFIDKIWDEELKTPCDMV